MRKSQKSFNSTLKSVSKKQEVELKRRRDLTADLIAEYGAHCMTCKDKKRDFRGLSLSHIIPLSRGGKTTRENCLIECMVDHDRYEKKAELRQQEHPELFKKYPYLVKVDISERRKDGQETTGTD